MQVHKYMLARASVVPTNQTRWEIPRIHGSINNNQKTPHTVVVCRPERCVERLHRASSKPSQMKRSIALARLGRAPIRLHHQLQITDSPSELRLPALVQRTGVAGWRHRPRYDPPQLSAARSGPLQRWLHSSSLRPASMSHIVDPSQGDNGAASTWLGHEGGAAFDLRSESFRR
jgi:hypothetical protein